MTNRAQWTIITIFAVVGLGSVVGLTYYLANRQVTPPAKTNVLPKKAKPTNEWRIGQLEHKVTALQHEVAAHKERITKLEKAAASAPALPTPQVGTPTPPKADVGAATKPVDNGWRPVLTKNGWIHLGPPSQVPPPKVLPKGIEGPDVR